MLLGSWELDDENVEEAVDRTEFVGLRELFLPA